jgi:hypothetical protein
MGERSGEPRDPGRSNEHSSLTAARLLAGRMLTLPGSEAGIPTDRSGKKRANSKREQFTECVTTFGVLVYEGRNEKNEDRESEKIGWDSNGILAKVIPRGLGDGEKGRRALRQQP